MMMTTSIRIIANISTAEHKCVVGCHHGVWCDCADVDSTCPLAFLFILHMITFVVGVKTSEEHQEVPMFVASHGVGGSHLVALLLLACSPSQTPSCCIVLFTGYALLLFPPSSSSFLVYSSLAVLVLVVQSTPAQ